MAKWKLTVREGSKVSRRGFADLEEAVTAAQEAAEEALGTPSLKAVKAFRDYEPSQQTKARIELSGKGLIKPPTAGVDIRGDNTAVGYVGAVRRRAFTADGTKQIFDRIRQALQDG